MYRLTERNDKIPQTQLQSVLIFEIIWGKKRKMLLHSHVLVLTATWGINTSTMALVLFVPSNYFFRLPCSPFNTSNVVIVEDVPLVCLQTHFSDLQTALPLWADSEISLSDDMEYVPQTSIEIRTIPGEVLTCNTVFLCLHCTCKTQSVPSTFIYFSFQK